MLIEFYKELTKLSKQEEKEGISMQLALKIVEQKTRNAIASIREAQEVLIKKSATHTKIALLFEAEYSLRKVLP